MTNTNAIISPLNKTIDSQGSSADGNHCPMNENNTHTDRQRHSYRIDLFKQKMSPKRADRLNSPSHENITDFNNFSSRESQETFFLVLSVINQERISVHRLFEG